MPINMEKRTEIAKESLVSLLKTESGKGNDLGELTAQIRLAEDYSGSMARFYASGEMQELTERVLALSLTGLDADGDIQVYHFDHQVYEPYTVDINHYVGAVDRWRFEEVTVQVPGQKKMFGKVSAPTTRVEKVERQMGGTDYAPCIRKIRQDARDSGDLAPGKPPVIVVFQTDGGTSSPANTIAELRDSSKDPIFWVFLGLGNNTGFLDVLDKIDGGRVDNVSKISVTSIKSVPDADFYAELIREPFSKWLPAARALGIVTV
jgi:hypothetical protein